MNRILRSAARIAALAVCLVGPVAPLRAHAAPDTLPAVRPARLAALSTPLNDGDLAWLLPLLAAQAADVRGAARRETEAARALAEGASAAATTARVAALRSGATDALAQLRRYSEHAAVPAGSRYDARCSAVVTEHNWGLITHAVFAARDVPAAREFYRRRGWRVLGDAHSGYVLVSPDRKVR